jgi:hypothetical protein
MNDYDPSIQLLRQMLGLSIINKLEECGFEELPNPRALFGLSRPELAEKVFARNVDEDGRIKVKVFTSVIGGSNDVPLEVRKEGKDAIRVCATYTSNVGKDRGLVKETRVNRTGNIDDIVDRMYKRMRSAYKSAKSGDKCHHCGAPKFVTKKGSTCCAEICWKTPEEKAKDDAAYQQKKTPTCRLNRRYSRRY